MVRPLDVVITFVLLIRNCAPLYDGVHGPYIVVLDPPKGVYTGIYLYVGSTHDVRGELHGSLTM